MGYDMDCKLNKNLCIGKKCKHSKDCERFKQIIKTVIKYSNRKDLKYLEED